MSNLKMVVTDNKSLTDAKTIVATGSTSGNYVYKDYETGLDVSPNDLLDKNRDILNQTTAKYNKGVARATGDVGFDHLIFEFGNLDEDTAKKYANAILETVANPDITWIKDQQSGGTHTKGKKQTVYDFHREPNGSFHMHVLCADIAIDNTNSACATSTFTRADYMNGVTRQINEKFKTLGLVEELTSRKGKLEFGKKSVSQENKDLATQVVKGTVTSEELYQKVQDITSFDQSSIGGYLNTIQDQIGKHAQEMERLQVLGNTLNQYQKVQSGLIEQAELNKKLNGELTEVKTELETVKIEKAEFEKNLKTVTEEFNDQLQQKDFDLMGKISTIDDLQEKLVEEKQNHALEFERAEQVEKEKELVVEKLTSVITTYDTQIASLNTQLNAVNGTVNAQGVTITTLTEKNETLTNEKHKLLETVKGYIPKVKSLDEVKAKFAIPDGVNASEFIENQMKALEERLTKGFNAEKETLNKGLEDSKKALAEEQAKTALLVNKLDKQEKDFKEFFKEYFTEISSKLKNAGEVIAKLAKQISEPSLKTSANKVAKDIKSIGAVGGLDKALSQFTAKPQKPDDDEEKAENKTKPKL